MLGRCRINVIIKQSNRQINKQTNKQTNTQTNTNQGTNGQNEASYVKYVFMDF